MIQAELDAITATADRRVIDTEIRSMSRQFRVIDGAEPDVAALIERTNIAIDEAGNITGVEDAIKALKTAKPWMFQPAVVGADAVGSNPFRNSNKSELAAKESELAELKAAATWDRGLIGKVTALYNEILVLKSRRG